MHIESERSATTVHSARARAHQHAYAYTFIDVYIYIYILFSVKQPTHQARTMNEKAEALQTSKLKAQRKPNYIAI